MGGLNKCVPCREGDYALKISLRVTLNDVRRLNTYLNMDWSMHLKRDSP